MCIPETCEPECQRSTESKEGFLHVSVSNLVHSILSRVQFFQCPQLCFLDSLDGTLPCASAKRSRILLEVFDYCSSVGRRLSPCERAIIREVKETVFCSKFLGDRRYWLILSHAKKWFLPCCPLIWYHLHFVVSTLLFVTSEHQGEAALRRLRTL